jgi:hypothetical protein
MDKLNNTKFTPGPWRHCECGKCQTVWGGVDGSILVHDTPKDEDIATPTSAMGIANARLIASAPELYEAIKEMNRLWMQNVEWHDWEPCVRKAEEALAKAEGR